MIALSEGQRLLVRELGRITGRELARKCKCTAATLSALAIGVHRFPSLLVALGLEQHAGISPRTWLQAPVSKSTAVDLTEATLDPKAAEAAE